MMRACIYSKKKQGLCSPRVTVNQLPWKLHPREAGIKRDSWLLKIGITAGTIQGSITERWKLDRKSLSF